MPGPPTVDTAHSRARFSCSPAVGIRMFFCQGQAWRRREVGPEYYTFTNNDLTPIILKLRAANPDVLHHISRDQDAILFWRQRTLFPVVRAWRAQLAHTLSGGEPQQVAIGRGLMARPRLLMVDEPFLGLAPQVVQEIGHLLRRIRDDGGIALVFIEQKAELALRLADRGYVLESGRAILNAPSTDLLQSPEVRRIFLGDAAL